MFQSGLTLKEDQLPRDTLAWMLVAQGLVIFPLFFYLPFWVPIIWVAVTFWRIQIYRGVWGFPGKLIKVLLGGCCVALLLVSFRGKLGVEPMVSFLLCGFILKLIEVHRRSDASVLLYICYIAVAAQFLFSQNVLTTAYALVCLFVVICAQRGVFTARDENTSKRCKYSAVLIAQSVPLMLVLFVVMPRLGQLWAVPSMDGGARTGFSDSMSPGSISELIKSQALAFRVTFDSEVPPTSERYWRGLVLEYFDGRNWQHRWFRNRNLSGRVQRGSSTPDDWNITSQEIAAQNTSRYRYSVILEPHNYTWLFALNTPVWMQVPQQLRAGFHEDFLLVSRIPISKRLQYQVESVLDHRLDVNELPPRVAMRNRQLPNEVNPRAQGLIEQWQSEGKNSQQIIDAALGFYNREFTYTLSPPALGADSIDEFLFITQRGFCEHFASSFVYLMRLANIPARVVVGYQGGQLNTVENYLMVRQSDAHAWAEVWLEGQGWTRVDPTAAVAPSRIEQGLAEAVGEAEAELLNGTFSFFTLSSLALYWDTIGYHWHRMVLSYDDESQKGLFEKLLGGAQVWRIGLWFLGVCAGLILLYMAGLVYISRAPQSREEKRLYLIFQRKLAKRGLERSPSETPETFAERVAESHPHWKDAVVRITRLYYRLAYQGDTNLQKHFAREVHQFPRGSYRQDDR